MFLDSKTTRDAYAFSKLPGQFGFAIEYTDSNGNLRYYEPDWVVQNDGKRLLAGRDKGS